MNLLLIPPLSSIRVMLTDRPSFNSGSTWIRKTLLPLVPYLSFHLLISSALLTSSGNICLAALDIFQDTISTFKCASGSTLTDGELFWDKKNTCSHWIRRRVQYLIFDLLISRILFWLNPGAPSSAAYFPSEEAAHWFPFSLIVGPRKSWQRPKLTLPLCQGRPGL